MSVPGPAQSGFLILFTDRVKVLRADIVRSGVYGRKRDWANSRIVFDGLACVQPDRSFEARTPERETAQERLLVFLPHGTDVASEDRVEYHGEVYEVDGDPQEWRHRSLRHVRIRAWKVEH